MMIHPPHHSIVIDGWTLFSFWLVCILATVPSSNPPTHTHLPRLSVLPFQVRDPPKLQSQLVTDQVLTILNQDKVYTHQEIDGYSGWGLVIQEVHASPTTIWNILLDFDKYPQRIPKVAACESYPGMGNYLYQHLTLGYRWLSLHVYVQHEPNDNNNNNKVLVWTLDSTQSSDVEESTGYWYIETHPTKEGWSRVTYHVHVTLMEWVPSFVWKFMTKQALEEATHWIKKYSQAEERRKNNHNNNRNPNQHPKSKSNLGYCQGGAGTTTAECLWEYWGFPSSSASKYVPPIGLSRYFLVSSVMGLLFFNTYLYFSHYR